MNFKEAVKKAIKSPNRKISYKCSDIDVGWVKLDQKKNKVVFFNTISVVEWSLTRAKLYGTTTYLKRYSL